MTEHDEFEHEVEDDEKGLVEFLKFVIPVLIFCATVVIALIYLFGLLYVIDL